MTIENIVAVVSLLGIGGLISAYFTLLWQRRSKNLEKMGEYKETRYKCILLLMRASLDFERYRGELQKSGYSIEDIRDLTALLRDEHICAFLYASDEFIGVFGEFIKSPSETSLVNVALSMRKDLWGVKTGLSSTCPEPVRKTKPSIPAGSADY
jgi:hypothetical protein